MKIDDEAIKNAYRVYLETRIPPSRDGCPSFDDILGLVDQPGRARYKEDLIEHIFQCRSCAEEFDLLRDIRKQESVLSHEIERIVQLSTKKGFLRNGLFGSLVAWRYAALFLGLIIMFSIVKLRQDHSSMSRYPSSLERSPRPAQPILLKPGRAAAPPFTWTFRWKYSEYPESYKLEIFDDALFPVLTETGLKDHEYQLSEQIAIKIPRSDSWFWMITAKFKDGNESASPIQRFGAGD